MLGFYDRQRERGKEKEARRKRQRERGKEKETKRKRQGERGKEKEARRKRLFFTPSVRAATCFWR